ncbi:MAG: hypothetical protein OXU67_02405, partial [Chloroflexota bacterium]|nr:hypothetical protein [Chloroflexota bacterium]
VAVARLGKHLGTPSTYPPQRQAVLPVGVLTPAMLAYPDIAIAAERDRPKVAQLAIPAHLPDERKDLDADALRPADCFRCGGVCDNCPLVAGPANWRACPYAYT